MMSEQRLRKLLKEKQDYLNIVTKRFMKYDNHDDLEEMTKIETMISLILYILEAA